MASDSYLVDFWDANDANFGFESPVGIFSTPVNVADPEQMSRLRSTVHAIATLSSKTQHTTWVDAFVNWQVNNGTTTQSSTNNALLKQFLESPDASRFKGDLVPVGENLVNARAWVWVVLAQDAEGNVKLTKKIRSTYDDNLQGWVPGFVWSDFFLTSDRYADVEPTVIWSQLVGICVVAVVCFLMLPPIAAAASILSILLVNINILGWASLWGVPISVTLAAILVLAMGFSVDYSAHIAEGLSTRALNTGRTIPEDPLEVVVDVLRSIGMSVLHGGLSTFMAVLMLGFSKSKGMQDLFKCLFLMVLFGLLHGFVLLPMLFLAVSKATNKFRRSLHCDGEASSYVLEDDSEDDDSDLTSHATSQMTSQVPSRATSR